MNMNYYQQKASETAIYPRKHSMGYLALGVTGEAGKIANKFKKCIRDHDGAVPEEQRQELIDECGDVLWYISQLLVELVCNMDDCAQRNLDKLRSRQERDALKGSGDKR